MVIVFLAGNVGADPETRFAPSGQKIISFRVASNAKRQGKDETTWWRVTVFGDRFDKMLSYVKKGSAIIVSGEMSTNLWTDKEGKQHIQHEVIADSIKFSPFGRSDRPEQSQAGNQGGYTAPQYNQQAPTGGYTPAPSPTGYAPQPTSSWSPPQQPFNPTMPEFPFGGTAQEGSMHSDHEEAPF